MQARPEDVQPIANMVAQLCGIVLDESKGYLIESRLSPLAEAAGCRDFTEFARRVLANSDPKLRSQVIDAITTQETLFFRDASPFEVLAHRIIPDLIDAKAGALFPRRLRIWSAACSTGQEPYSLAMTLRELLPDVNSWDVTILATDIADSAIRQASVGRYAEHEIRRGMKPQMLAKYFVAEGTHHRAKDELRAMIAFKQLNLLEPFTMLGPFDVILCRNVAIYFDPASRRNLFLRLADRLTADGALLVGSSESLADLGPQFMPLHHCRAIYYQPRKQAAPVLA